MSDLCYTVAGMVTPKWSMSTEGQTFQVSVLPYRCSVCPCCCVCLGCCAADVGSSEGTYELPCICNDIKNCELNSFTIIKIKIYRYHTKSYGKHKLIPNPLVQQIQNYTSRPYVTYTASISLTEVTDFLFIIFHCRFLHLYIHIYTGVPPYPQVVRSVNYRSYVKPRIIPNAKYNVIFV
jgi:hypothetical protein